MLARLRHGPVLRGDHEDRGVDLGRAGDHVLHVVGVAGHVDVGVVTGGRLVLHVRDVDGDPAQDLLGGAVDAVERHELVGGGVGVGEHLGDRGGQGRLPVVDVAHGPDVEVGLGADELALGHDCAFSLQLSWERVGAGPRTPPERR